jgi:hypothetical protein
MPDTQVWMTGFADWVALHEAQRADSRLQQAVRPPCQGREVLSDTRQTRSIVTPTSHGSRASTRVLLDTRRPRIV